MYYVFVTHKNKMFDNNIIESWKQKMEVYFYKVLLLYIKWYSELEGRQ